MEREQERPRNLGPGSASADGCWPARRSAVSAVSVGALPVILPVNSLCDGERILIRTGDGTKLAAAARMVGLLCPRWIRL